MKNRPKTVGFLSGERNVFLHILTACNLSCGHCYINKEQHGTQSLSTETMFSWIEMFASKEKKSNIIFLGGEPTLHEGLVDGIKFAKDLGYTVTVDTNGYVFNNLLEKSSPKHLDYLSFSLDGPDSETNDPIRGIGVFDICIAGIKKAIAIGYNVSLIYTVSSRNIDMLGGMVPLLRELGIKKFFIQVIGLRGSSAKSKTLDGVDDAWQVTKEKWLSVVPIVAQQAADTGIHVTYPKVFLNDDEIFECAGNVAENFFIFPNGRVYQCPLCEDHPIHAYTIQNNNLIKNEGLTESSFFKLDIKEGCVMNKLLQPDNIDYDSNGEPESRISCCLLKQEIG